MPSVTETMLWSLAGTRDVIIIATGSVALLLLIVALVFTVIVGVASRILLGTLKTLVKDDVTPLVGEARLTVKQVRGTTAFVSDTAVKPVIRVYGIFAGARRAFTVLVGIAGKRKNEP